MGVIEESDADAHAPATGLEPAGLDSPDEPAQPVQRDDLVQRDEQRDELDDEVWSHPPAPRPRDPNWRLVLVGLALLALAAALAGASVVRATTFSALDEATHVDYAWKVVHGSVPFDGDLIGAYTLGEWACHGQANIANLPPCGSDAPSSDFPAGGANYNGFHPPVYYFITGLGAEAIGAVTGASFFTGARLMSMVWSFAGLFTFYLVLRYWRVRWPYALAYSALLITLPSVFASATAVTNDAPALLCGTAALFVLGRVMIYRRAGWVLPALLTLLVASTKVISVVALAAVAGVLLLWALTRLRGNGFRAVRPLLVIAVAVAASTAVVYLAWSLVQHRLAMPGYVNPIAGVSTRTLSGRFPLGAWLPTLFNGFDLGTDYYLDPPVNNSAVLAWGRAGGVFFAAIGFVALARSPRRSASWWGGLALVVGCLLYPLMVQVQSFVSSSGRSYFPAPSGRYGETLIPLGVALMALLASRYGWRKGTVATVAVGVLVALTGTFGLA